MENNAIKTGGCLCGAVRYEIDGPLRDIISCHCGQCQKTSGHYFAATATPKENFHLIKDEGLKWYNSSEWGERGFCAECGSTLFWRLKDKSHQSILAGSLDGDTGLKTSHHIYVADKKDYYEITDGVPQYDTNPEELENG